MIKFINRVLESIFINGAVLLVVTLFLSIMFLPPYLMMRIFLDDVGGLYFLALALYWMVAYRYLKPEYKKYFK